MTTAQYRKEQSGLAEKGATHFTSYLTGYGPNAITMRGRNSHHQDLTDSKSDRPFRLYRRPDAPLGEVRWQESRVNTQCSRDWLRSTATQDRLEKKTRNLVLMILCIAGL